MATPNIYGNPGPDSSSRLLVNQKGQKTPPVTAKAVDASGLKNRRGAVPMGKSNPGLDDNGRRPRPNYDAGTPKSLGF